MDNLKEKIEEIINKVKEDKDFAKKFMEDPVKALEEVIGVDLPDDKINELIAAIKAKINLDNNEVLNKIKGLFD